MKLSVEFPSVSYREGPEGVRRFARTLEQIGYDHIDVFDHVVMGHPMAGRPPGPYNAQMPILEALILLSHVAAVTTRMTLGTEVLVLPQRQPALVAKQVSTLDTLSGGRVRLGVGVGWQESEYEALGVDFHTRGARMDEAIALLRSYWSDAQVTAPGEPPPRGPGGGGDPAAIGLQSMVAPPPRDAEGKRFYAEPDRVVARVAALKAMGFQWAALNATAVFQAGARSVDAMLDTLAKLHDRI